MSRNGLARTWQQVLQPHSLSATTRCRRHAFSTTVLVLAIALALPGTPAASDAPVPETIVFGGDADYPPFEWLDDGSPTGFNIELEQAIAEAGARKARHRLGNWADAVRALEAGTVDAVPMFQTPQREQRFLFSDPIHFVETEAFGLASAGNIDQPSDLSGKRVAVERGSHAAPRLRSDVATIELVETKDTLAALRSVAAGHAEYAVLSTLVARQLIRRHGLPLERKGPPLWSHPYAFAVTRDREALADWIDRSFDRMVATGEFGRIHARWEDQLDPTPINWRHVLEFAGLIAAPLLLLAGLVLAWNRLLQNRVTARTAELSAELERRLEAEASLRHHAQYEIATGLPRRWHFLGLADEALARATPGARAEIIVLHFRNLDEITRFFGHAKGESGQRAFAERLRACELDAIGHFGGRTFAAVATGTHVGTLIESLSATLSIESLEFNPVVLAGVARAPDHGMCASDLVPRAETALTGVTGPRSTWAMYDESMEPDSDDLQLVRDFQQGDGGGMYAVYQPQVDLSDGACVGCEALVRWQHDRLGMVPPARFIPLLERTGLIATLTSRMLDHAIGFAAQLRAAGIACPVSVNVSVQDLLEPNLVGKFERALRRHGAHPEDIKIELTETSFSEGKEGVNDTLDRLHDLGIRSSIDDFGTGYASLTYLSQFAVNEVKIDRMFVDNMSTNPRDRAIVRATIGMAHDMALTVTAEGAEDEETLEALREEGCDHVQGYVISKPLASKEMSAFADARGRRL